MRPFLPIAAVVLLTAGAAALPALTQAAQTQTKHHVWKKANIDTAAMSASMSAQNPDAFAPSTASAGAAAEATDQQPGAIAPATSAGTQTNVAPATAVGTGMSDPASPGPDMGAKTGADTAGATAPDASKAGTTPPAMGSSASQ